MNSVILKGDPKEGHRLASKHRTCANTPICRLRVVVLPLPWMFYLFVWLLYLFSGCSIQCLFICSYGCLAYSVVVLSVHFFPFYLFNGCSVYSMIAPTIQWLFYLLIGLFYFYLFNGCSNCSMVVLSICMVVLSTQWLLHIFDGCSIYSYSCSIYSVVVLPIRWWFYVFVWWFYLFV